MEGGSLSFVAQNRPELKPAESSFVPKSVQPRFANSEDNLNRVVTKESLYFMDQLINFKRENSDNFRRSDNSRVQPFLRYILSEEGSQNVFLLESRHSDKPTETQIGPKRKDTGSKRPKTKRKGMRKRKPKKRTDPKPPNKSKMTGPDSADLGSQATDNSEPIKPLEEAQEELDEYTPGPAGKTEDDSQEDVFLRAMEESDYEAYLTPYQQYIGAGGTNPAYIRQLKQQHDEMMRQKHHNETDQQQITPLPIHRAELKFYQKAIWGAKSQRGNLSWNEIVCALTGYGWQHGIQKHVSSGFVPPEWFPVIGLPRFMISVHKDHEPDNKPVRWYCLYYLRTGLKHLGLTLEKIEALFEEMDRVN